MPSAVGTYWMNCRAKSENQHSSTELSRLRTLRKVDSLINLRSLTMLGIERRESFLASFLSSEWVKREKAKETDRSRDRDRDRNRDRDRERERERERERLLGKSQQRSRRLRPRRRQGIYHSCLVSQLPLGLRMGRLGLPELPPGVESNGRSGRQRANPMVGAKPGIITTSRRGVVLEWASVYISDINYLSDDVKGLLVSGTATAFPPPLPHRLIILRQSYFL